MASSNTAISGATITLTISPEANYELDTITVKNARTSNAIALTDQGDNKYAFYMPSDNVTAEVSFRSIPANQGNTTDSDYSGDQNDGVPSQPQPTPWDNPFIDVMEETYYYDAVRWAVENAVTQGRTSTTFEPGDACSRANAVTFLWRAAGSPTPNSSENPFVDVASDAYYYEAVLWATEQGITKGQTSTTFEPNSKCNRGQIVTFLYRHFSEKQGV